MRSISRKRRWGRCWPERKRSSRSVTFNCMETRSGEMSCLSDGILRAHFDSELSQPELLECEQHLASCSECRARSEGIGQNAKRVGAVLSTLAPLHTDAPSDARIAWARF